MKTNTNPIHPVWVWDFWELQEGSVPLPGGIKIPVSAIKRLQVFPLMKRIDRSDMKNRWQKPGS